MPTRKQEDSAAAGAAPLDSERASRIAALESERRDLVRQMKRSLRDHGEGRYLDRIDRQLADLRAAIKKAEA